MNIILFSSFLYFLFLPTDAFAYLDPATGSVIIQSLIASLVAGGFVIKTYWFKISSLFSRKIKNNLEKDETKNNLEKDEINNE